MTPISLVGAGGHARVVYDLVQLLEPGRAVRWHDDAWQTLLAVPPIVAIEPIDTLVTGSEQSDVFVAIGDAKVRLSLMEALQNRGHRLISLVHPFTSVSPYSEIGAGSICMAGVILQSGALLGRGVIINTAASVDHDCVIGDGTHIAPGARLAGGVTVGEQAWIGAGSVVREGVSVGARATIGAGAVVVHDVPEGSIRVGNPARDMAER
ncbi:MAG: acetyltransferase [Pseudomonadales bacterium]